MRNIPFSPPDMTEAEASMVSEVLGSGWITTGPKTKEFEHLISMCCGTSRAVCLNSATVCMEMALRIIGVGPGDEVIVPAYTYTATASAVCHVGARPVMVDCAPGSYQMDYGKMAGAITERTKAVMPVDLGGVVCDYDRIFGAVEAAKGLFRPSNDIQRAFGRVIVIADAAHAFGARWHGKMCGDIADFTSFSFHAVKTERDAPKHFTFRRFQNWSMTNPLKMMQRSSGEMPLPPVCVSAYQMKIPMKRAAVKKMSKAIFPVTMKADGLRGGCFRSSGFGGSVASASAAIVSMMRLIQSI